MTKNEEFLNEKMLKTRILTVFFCRRDFFSLTGQSRNLDLTRPVTVTLPN